MRTKEDEIIIILIIIIFFNLKKKEKKESFQAVRGGYPSLLAESQNNLLGPVTWCIS